MDTEMKEMFSLILDKLGSIDNRLDSVENCLDAIENRLEVVDNRSQENQDMLKALLHAHELTDAKVEANTISLAKMQGKLTVTSALSAQNSLEICDLTAEFKKAK